MTGPLSPDTRATLRKRRHIDKLYAAYVAKFGPIAIVQFDDETVAAMEQSLATGEDVLAAYPKVQP